MSRAHDLVEIMVSDFRITSRDLCLDERLQLFEAYINGLHRRYSHLRGGSQFVSWKTENLGERLTDHSIRRYSLTLIPFLFPQSPDYDNKKTRITVLASDYFKLPEFKKPDNGEWKLGDIRLVIRLCLTQEGDLYLEWYEGEVRSIENGQKGIPTYIPVNVARYIKLPPCMRLNNSVPDELKTILESSPEILLSFGYGVLKLLSDEIKNKQEKIDRDRILLARFNIIGQALGITHY